MLAIMLIHLYSLGAAFDRIDEFFFLRVLFPFLQNIYHTVSYSEA